MTDRSGIITIVIADDHPIFRDGLRKLLDAAGGFQIVGEAGDGLEAVQVVKRLRPDILLLDLLMPRQGGLKSLRELEDLLDTVRTIILTVSIQSSEVVEALQLGARGVVLKESATEILLKGIRTVMAGQYWVGRREVAGLVEALRDLKSTAGSEAQRRYHLTNRELQVVAAVAAGRSNKEIAQDLSISEETVKHHMTSIFDKLGVSTRLELALFAADRHLVDRNPPNR